MTDELPSGWAVTTVGNVCPTTQYGYTASASEIECGPRFLRITDIQDGAVNWDGVPFCEIAERDVEKYCVSSGDLLVARTGGTVGKSFLISFVPGPTVFASYLIRISPASEVVPAYLYYFFQSGSYWQQIGLKKGGLLGNVNATTLASIELPICPKPEQQRIVSKIDELFSRIDEGERALERVQKLVERYRQSVLKAAVTGELTRDWREKNKHQLESGEALLARILKARRAAWEKAELDKMKAKGITPANDKWKQKYEEPMAPNTDGLPELPEGWVWASVDQVSLNLDGKRIPLKAADRDKRSGPYPYYGAQGVIDDIDDFLFDGDFLLVAEDGENLRSRIKPLAFNASGKFWVNNHAHILSPVPGIHRDFLRAAINSLNISRSVTGTAQPKLTQAALSKLAVPITSDQEQRAVVALLDAATNNSNAATAPVASELRRAAGLRQSILKSAFSGALVDHDPTDEPAAVLLKRISADGTATPAKPQRGRKPKTQESA